MSLRFMTGRVTGTLPGIAELHGATSELYPLAWGEALYRAVRLVRPERIVEFGSGHGFTTLCLALAAHDNGVGRITSFDLWETKPNDAFSQKGRRQFRRAVRRYRPLAKLVEAETMDFWDWLKQPSDFDLLYLDINNNGDVIRRAWQVLRPQLDAGAVLLFEGGVAERDASPKHRGVLGITAVKELVGYELLCDEMPGLGVIAPTVDMRTLVK